MLTQAAQVRAEEMAAAGTYSHTRPDGSQYYTVADCPYMAENIHRIADRRLKTLGKGLAEAAVDDWAASSGHLKNILNDGAVRDRYRTRQRRQRCRRGLLVLRPDVYL